MNKRQLKKRYKKLYDYNFIKNKILEWGIEWYTIDIAFYDVKEKLIGIILDKRNHGYYDIRENTLIF